MQLVIQSEVLILWQIGMMQTSALHWMCIREMIHKQATYSIIGSQNLSKKKKNPNSDRFFRQQTPAFFLFVLAFYMQQAHPYCVIAIAHLHDQ